MTIHVVAKDPELYTLCRDILADIPESGHSWTLVAVSPEDARREADLYIWDFHPNLPIPEDFNWSSVRHIFLVDRNDLEVFRQWTGGEEGNVLVKPVGRATVAPILLAAVSNGAAKALRTDRDEMLQCLIQSHLKLQQYDHDRASFLGRVVHDLRAPLTALGGYCGLLLSDDLGSLNESQKEVLRRMQNSAKRLSRMASAMFELSVGQNGNRRPDWQPGDMRESLQQAWHEVGPFADEKSISITSDLAPCDGLYFEAGQIEQVFINVLDNACRFTPRGGVIEIRGYPFFWERRVLDFSTPPALDRRRKRMHEANSYRVDISDSGASIPEEYLESIFGEHTSYTGGRDRSGGGLGLAICKMIVAQHHGRIWAENRDSGPVFSFVIPILSMDPHLPALADYMSGHGHSRGSVDAD